ncbi:MAG: GNAT family N-acyltransferase [Paracoccaceae bacterium]
MLPLSHGNYTAKLAETPAEHADVRALRHVSFRAARGLSADDSDGFDAICQHLLVSDASDRPVCCARLLILTSGAQIEQSYSAQFYDLTRLAGFPGKMMELGRFCLRPDIHDPHVLRLVWAALTRLVDTHGIGMLFGCSSFDGADPTPHRAALAYLAAHHLAPPLWAPAAKASEVIDVRQPVEPDVRAIPTLLRTYLGMGGWVSDHAVIDRELNTLHVLTGLEIASVPLARARALRALAGQE